jgi:hypothetical protein
MAAFTFFHEFGNHLGTGVHNLSTGSFKLGLSNTGPSAANNTVWADITEISAGNGYSAAGPTLDSEAWAETGSGTGIWQFTSADEVITASGGSIGPFRYPIVYNDTPTSPADPLVGYLDYGSSITVTNGNTFTFDVGANGIFRLGAGTIS